MKVFFVLTAVLAAALALPLSDLEEQQWQNFKEVHGKSYKTQEEENFRKEIFAQNLKKYEEHNKMFEAGLVSYTKGVTLFADITAEEFAEMFPPMNVSAGRGGIPFVPLENVELPASIDWRHTLTPVKHQGDCGSCYAFSATGTLEAHLFLKTGKKVSLSEQNLVDCTKGRGNFGCRGGYPSKCFQYIQSNGGIDTEQSYPYQGVEGQCRYNPSNSGGTDQGAVDLPAGDEQALTQAVGTIGPVAICLNAAPLDGYRGGIIDGPCSETINHAVVAVGYGSENGQDYWLVRNSWGETFGEGGYFRIARGKNQCGLTSISSYPRL